MLCYVLRVDQYSRVRVLHTYIHDVVLEYSLVLVPVFSCPIALAFVALFLVSGLLPLVSCLLSLVCCILSLVY